MRRFTMVNPSVVGADLGQSCDPSAIAVVERIVATHPRTGAALPTVFAVRYLERLPLGTPYPAVAARLVALFDRAPLADGTLVVDLLRTPPLHAPTADDYLGVAGAVGTERPLVGAQETARR
jgi:hypothetical protein